MDGWMNGFVQCLLILIDFLYYLVAKAKGMTDI